MAKDSLKVVIITFGETIWELKIAGAAPTQACALTTEESVQVKSSEITNLRREKGAK